MPKDKVLVTGADSYIGQMLFKEQSLQDAFNWAKLGPDTGKDEIISNLSDAKFLLHLFESKSGSDDRLMADNAGYTGQLIELMEESGHTLPFIYISSDYDDSEYGRSKLLSEQLIREYGQRRRIRNMIYRLPVLMGERLYLDEANPLHDLCYQLIFDRETIVLPDRDEHKFVDIKDVTGEIARALSGRAFYATVDLSICVVPSEHYADWERVLSILREIKERGEDYPLPLYRKSSLEYKLYLTYHSLLDYYSTREIK
ncbi:MAG: hypothetical protein GX763_08020 [Clostridiaceae bacterium]|nr:hypothetical protein [Clostridiaceae bacterium]